ncbi:hypothetical protein PRVXH_001762 [Proteinivorax hydrogeniformans]|uniref:Uncharacterized protein n=1 Tax=Proteinivorax hydrogeniformans TaxID=1826727 RepID=A0AAU8HQM4_9FIRM
MMKSCSCCLCPEGLEPLLDRKVKVATKCGDITGILRAFGETFLEVEEDDFKTVLTVIQCEKVCYIRQI